MFCSQDCESGNHRKPIRLLFCFRNPEGFPRPQNATQFSFTCCPWSAVPCPMQPGSPVLFAAVGTHVLRTPLVGARHRQIGGVSLLLFPETYPNLRDPWVKAKVSSACCSSGVLAQAPLPVQKEPGSFGLRLSHRSFLYLLGDTARLFKVRQNSVNFTNLNQVRGDFYIIIFF